MPVHRLAPLLVAGLLVVLHALTGVAQAAPPVNTAVPGVSGEYRVGQMLTGTRGTWTPTTGLQYTDFWDRCDAEGASCAPIAGISGLKYTLGPDDLGKTIRFRVRAHNTEAETYATSAASPIVAARRPPEPVETTPPTVSGLAREGQTLTATDGGWSGPGTITTTRKWQRCDLALTTCTPIGASATATTYKLVPDDIGWYVRVEVSAKNSDGTTTAVSGPTAKVEGVAPMNTVAPTITGPARDGQVLKLATPGTWTGTAPQNASFQWERCAATGEPPCDVVADATQTTYTLGPADIDRTLRLVVTQSNVAGSGSAPSLASAKVTAKAPPQLAGAPAISGTPMDTATLTAADGSWTGTPTIKTTRVWQRCSAAGTDCADITPAATAATYKLVAEDVGRTLRTRVTATNDDGTQSALSGVTAVVAAAPPTLTTAPAVTVVGASAARDGALLSTTTGTWKGTATIAYDFEWLRCAGTECVPIDNAAAQTYRLTADDIGTQVKAKVTAWNSGGSTPATSNATATVTAGPPVNIALPEIAGEQPRDGVLYASTPGTWGGTGTPSYERQWMRCNATGASCTVISGAIGESYRLQSADVGKTIRVSITAINAQGSAQVQSAASPTVLAARPEIDGAVTITGALRDGQTLTAGGTWKGTTPITFTYQWQRCALTCADITGATAQTYKLLPADVGARVRVRVGASNSGGGGAADSAETTVVGADPPVRTAHPVLSGTARSGSTLTTTTGTFTGTAPIDRTYTWERCTVEGTGCQPIGGATQTTYVLTEADRGATVRAVVRAQNSGGADTGTTALSAVVAAAPPTNTILPSVSPNTGLRDGAELTSTRGTWAGSSPMSYAVKWQRCSSAGANCVDIVGSGGETYVATTADVGYTLRSNVTATNGAGSDSRQSLATGVVGTNPPVNVTPPTIDGETVDGELTAGELVDGRLLRAQDGTWDGLVSMTATYEWWRCDGSGQDCEQIPGATAATYRLTPSDVRRTVKVRVTMASPGGSTGKLSAATAAVAPAPPERLTSPQIIGGAAVGKTVSATPGTWKGTPELHFTYQWQHCAADGSACEDIPGANASTYLVPQLYDEQTLRVVVVATNDIGADTATSPTTLQIEDDPPVQLLAPTITAPEIVAEGVTLRGDPGTWGGAQPVTFSYQWRRCDVAQAGCTNIDGATGRNLVLTRDDVGSRVVLVVTAENVVDIASAETEATQTVQPEPPANTVLPQITATAGVRDGAKLTATTGTWKGATPMSYAVTWMRCDAAGATCAPATETPGTSYVLTSEDVGHRIRARVTARNVTTEVTVSSSPTSVVGAAAPVSKVKPTIVAVEGKPVIGGRLRGVAGTFTGTSPMTVTYQWQRCVGTSAAACDDITTAKSEQYTVTEADVSRKLRVVVTARNAGGSVTVESASTEAVPALAPASGDMPTITGAAVREGVELTARPGRWNGTQPITLGYQWERCNEPGTSSCPKITGASRQTFTPAASEVGKYLRVTVIAVNSGGKVTKSSVPTGAVEGVLPYTVSPPVASVKGTIKVGGTVAGTMGKWGGTVPMKTEIRWQTCDVRGVVCEDIEKARTALYKLAAEDVSGTLLARPLRVVVTATNIAGSVEAVSALLGGPASATGAVAPAATRAPAKKATKKKAAKKKAAGKTLASIKRLRFTPKGRLLITLSCAKKAKTTCGASGTITSGKLKFRIDVGPIKQGRGLNVGLPLGASHKKRLSGRARVLFRTRLAPPSRPTKRRSRSIKVAVPKKLSGKVKKAGKLTAQRRKQAAAKRQAAAKQRAASTTSAPAATIEAVDG